MMSETAVGDQPDGREADRDPDADAPSWDSVVQGHNLDVLEQMPTNSLDAIVTSPPYWALRDYDGAETTFPDGWTGQLGQEPTVEQYLEHLLVVFQEARRVLKPSGALWVNIDDKYTNSPTGSQPSGADGRPSRDASKDGRDGQDWTFSAPYKSRNAIPERFVARMVQDGWVYRNDVVWNKSNAMPEAVKDRLARRWEHVYLFTPSADTWFDLDAIRQPHAESSQRRVQRNSSGAVKNGQDVNPSTRGSNDGLTSGSTDDWMHPNGKNPGDVWEFSTANYPDAHFAVFPEDLPERAIKATVPPKVCPQCGTPMERVKEDADPWKIDRTGRPQAIRAIELAEEHDLTTEHLEAIRARGLNDPGGKTEEAQTGTGRNTDDVEELAHEAKEALGGYYREFTATGEVPVGWEPGCSHDVDPTDAPSGTVMDPFGGAGTTGKVAKHLDRRWLVIEISDEYADQARDRISGKTERTASARRRAKRAKRKAEQNGQTQTGLDAFDSAAADADQEQ